MENQTIIVKKIKKGGHGHHGGAWKVAFADFAVAMMAFFLLLWLIASTTKEEQAGLSEYFSPPTQGLADGSGTSEDIVDMGGGQKISQGDDSKQDAREPTVDEIREVIEAERQQLESLLQELKMAIENSEALKPFKDQLLLDITPEGLRIQIVDKEGRPMFDSGGGTLKPYSRTILREIAKVIDKVPNKLSLTGHTDATKFVSRKGYSNWELSADRANASRRELIAGGYDAGKIAKVVGLASMVPFDKENPRDPVNRRIAIIVLNKAAEAALLHPAQTASDGDETQALLDSNAEGESGAPLRRFRSAIGDLRVQQAVEREAAAINPIPDIEPVHEPVKDDEAIINERKKPVDEHKQSGKQRDATKDIEEPDYTGMSIAERIKARAEWNKRRAEAAKR
ncbi:MAG TPA: motility protein MotB [Gammaproteobacteria bacterium]|nr:motility protein MotB [Gammaproteobacteria bacterium]